MRAVTIVFLIILIILISAVLSSRSKTHLSKRALFVHFARQISDDASPGVYHGPTAEFSDMLSGCEIQDLGITMMVGPSKVASGNGLYVAINENVESVTVPYGTVLCGYSKGTFTAEADGDKTVAYLLDSPYSGVLYNKSLTPLHKLIGLSDKRQLLHIIKGHELRFDNETNDILVLPDLSFENRYFVPHLDPLMGPGSMGVYANDLGILIT